MTAGARVVIVLLLLLSWGCGSTDASPIATAVGTLDGESVGTALPESLAPASSEVETTISSSSSAEIPKSDEDDAAQVREFLTDLAQGNWESAANVSSMTSAELLDAVGLTVPGDLGEAGALELACFAGGLCTEPIQVVSSGDGVVSADFRDGSSPEQKSSSTFLVDGGGVKGMPPFSLDQRDSRCNVIELSGLPAVSKDQTPPEQTPPGAAWKGVADAADTILIAWSGGELGPFGSAIPESSVDLPAIGVGANVYRIEGGFAAEFLLPNGCGRYTIWTFESEDDPGYLLDALRLMGMKS